jgi:hypothetical protein
VAILGASFMHMVWILVGTMFASIPLGLSCWALLDAAHRPSWAWAMTRHRQAAWMAAILFGVLILIGGLTISLWYLVKVRPVVAGVEAGDLRL